jgi:hypothetical protein
MSNTQYITVFFEEKQVEYKEWFLTDKQGNLHIIDTDFVIDFLKKDKIRSGTYANIIRKIDFANGNIHHFLEYVAKGLVK